MSNTSYIICVAVAAWLAFLVISDFPERYITGFS